MRFLVIDDRDRNLFLVIESAMQELQLERQSFLGADVLRGVVTDIAELIVGEILYRIWELRWDRYEIALREVACDLDHRRPLKRSVARDRLYACRRIGSPGVAGKH